MMIRKILALLACSLVCGSMLGSSRVPVANLPGKSVSLESSSVSFAAYGYFIDRLTFPSKKIGQVWASPRSVYEGPFHTNDTLRIYLPPHYFEESHAPFFRGAVTAVGPKIEYYEGYGPVSADGQPDSKRWGMVFQGEVKTGVGRIPLPDHPELSVRDGALGQATVPKMKGKIFLPADANRHLIAGIFVHGNLDTLTFQAQPERRIEIGFAEKKNTWLVDVDYSRGMTVLRHKDQVEQYQGVPNGAIYVAGSIGDSTSAGLSGKVTGRWTVAAEGDLFIPDHLLYAHTPAGSPPQGEDALALVGRSIFITKKAPDLLYLYATIFAARREEKEMVGTLFVLSNPDFPHRGHLIWWGNYVGVYPAIMGKFNRNTGESTDGYDLHKYYDARLASQPPPFFPTLEQVKVEVR